VPSDFTRRCVPLTLALALWASPAAAQVTEVVVGVTPTCPYGISACWPGAREGLGRLSGVESVAEAPDSYNCTGVVRLKHGRLPDIDKWPKQFAAVVGEVFIFRGVEVTARGTVEGKGDKLLLRVPGVKEPIPLAPLRNKLQWNFRKGAARQPEPDERRAWKGLAAGKRKAKAGTFQVEVTGPLRRSGKKLVLEVREYFPERPARPRRME
jgi:galactose oxidase